MGTAILRGDLCGYGECSICNGTLASVIIGGRGPHFVSEYPRALSHHRGAFGSYFVRELSLVLRAFAVGAVMNAFMQAGWLSFLMVYLLSYGVALGTFFVTRHTRFSAVLTSCGVALVAHGCFAWVSDSLFYASVAFGATFLGMSQAIVCPLRFFAGATLFYTVLFTFFSRHVSHIGGSLGCIAFVSVNLTVLLWRAAQWLQTAYSFSFGGALGPASEEVSRV